MATQKWEYKILKRNGWLEETMNSLGADGWELVAVTCSGPDWQPTMYFKRPAK